MMSDEKDDNTYTPVFEPFAEQPYSQVGGGPNVKVPGRAPPRKRNSAAVLTIVRDQFNISTWLLMGASLQCGLVAIFGARIWIVGLPVLVLGLRFIKTLLQAQGLLKNPYMEGVVRGATTCHFPEKDGSYQGPPSNKSLAVLLISIKSNHALGLLGPGMKEAGEFFDNCVAWLEEDSHARGFLGMTRWLGSGERTTSNEILSIGYFRSVEDIQALAHHAVHRAPWKWWNGARKNMDYITLTHEIFSCDAGNWENVFLNAKPTHLGTTVVKGDDGRWRSPLIYISAAHKSNAKRMKRKQTEAEQQREQETEGILGESY